MHRTDDSNYVLYIEPPAGEKLEHPIVDKLTSVMEHALSKCISGVAQYSDVNDSGTFNDGLGYKGFHRSECGQMSDNHDHLLENGMITNSLAPFYLKYYRNSIPSTELEKVEKLFKFYMERGFDDFDQH